MGIIDQEQAAGAEEVEHHVAYLSIARGIFGGNLVDQPVEDGVRHVALEPAPGDSTRGQAGFLPRGGDLVEQHRLPRPGGTDDGADDDGAGCSRPL